jgi:hypothetical protein
VSATRAARRLWACAFIALATASAAEEAEERPGLRGRIDLRRKVEQQDEVIRSQAEQIQRLEDRLRAIEDQQADTGARAVHETTENMTRPEPTPEQATEHLPNTGHAITQNRFGQLRLRLYTYVRYLNQKWLKENFTDSFGRTSELDLRQDVQLNKVKLETYGWVLAEKLRYVLYAWTSNASQGQGAQVVLAGNLRYELDPKLAVAGGITSLPGVRTTSHQFPFWLTVDNRMIADEFFRPSYTSGVWAFGELIPGLEYFAMLGNNLSILGVDAGQLDDRLDTFSTTLSWEPTDDYGRAFGDYEWHSTPSTRFAIHYTHSTEDRQGQPDDDDFDNSQIRLSDGNNIFQPIWFSPGTQIEQVRYQMASFDTGIKYQGLSLEAEYYYRYLSDLRGTLIGALPFSHRDDHGFQVQGSAMLLKEILQLYVGGSKIFGQYGDPWDTSVGLNWFPFRTQSFRWNNELRYLYNSPVGGIAYPYLVGGRGVMFQSNVELAF